MMYCFRQFGSHRLLNLLLAGGFTVGFLPRPLLAVEVDVRRDAVVEAIEKVMPGVVNIATSRIVEYSDFYDPIFREFFGLNRPTQRREELNSIGSGVIIDEDGYVLTNLHVLRRASRVQVKLSDGRLYDAEPVVVTTQSDLALLKLKANPGEKFKAIKLAKGDDLLLGETVLALGNPYGLGGSVSRGILSSKNRRPASGNEPLNIEDWLQTDASINPGNSGGPLIDLRGELIGLSVAIYPEGHGIGFAIPVKQISAALSQFFTPEVTDSLSFGARIRGDSYPLVVAEAQPGSPAERAGLRPGQQILQVNGRTPKNLVDFNRFVGASADHTVTLQVQDGGGVRTLKAQMIPFDDLIRQKLGLILLNLTPQTAARFGVDTGEGLFIEEVEKNGPADQAKLQRGYLLKGVDGENTSDLMAVADILSAKKKGDAAQLTVVVPRRIGNNYVEYHQGTVALQVR